MICSRCGKPIDEHEAGRETDACVAVVVMKHEVERENYQIYYRPWWEKSKGRINHLKRYSTSIADAWAVMEKMKEMGAAFGIEARWCNICTVEFYIPLAKDDPRRDKGYGNWKYTAEAETYSLAICRAALKACGGE